MKERRSLVDGLKDTPDAQEVEKAFVYGDKAVAKPIETPAEPVAATSGAPSARQDAAQPDNSILPHMKGRVPITTRCRPEVASALKRASLQRQLAGIEPHYVQDIMEEALEAWLSHNRHL